MRELERNARLQPHAQRLTEVNALLNANRAKSELSGLQSRIEFQTLLVQLFLQRRFRHVLIGSRFYRSIFDDGDNQLRLGEETKSVFAKLSDIPPTVTSLDARANEAILDVKEGVEAVNFLLEKDELQSLAQSLSLMTNSLRSRHLELKNACQSLSFYLEEKGFSVSPAEKEEVRALLEQVRRSLDYFKV